jgi:hypothetical protein
MSSGLKNEETSLQFVRRNQRGSRELTPYSALHRSIVTVYVSPEKYPFYFHKGRLCQHSSFFEKAFHGSFQEATTGSMYLEEDGVDEFKLFEEWLYTEKFNYPKDSDNPSLLLMKVFCFADKIRSSTLQNATLDAIRDRATEQRVSLPTPHSTYETYAKPQTLWGSAPRPLFDFQIYQTTKTSPVLEEPVAKYLPPATSSAITYAYQNTPERSPLRKLLTDIFAFNVKPETLDEDILLFPAEFMADVLLINMKRLPLRLSEEEADFDKNADKYHVHDSSSTRNRRKERTSEDVKARGIKSNLDSHNGPVAEAPDPEPESPTEATAVDEDDTGGVGMSIQSLSGKGKKKGKRIT